MLNIIGGVCFLLWGLRAVRNGITRAFGADLHSFVSRNTRNRMTAFASGVGVTALLQSSTATSFIAAAFCGQGIMTLSSGLAVILGANVGTAMVARILSFNLSWLAPLLIIVGYTIFAINKKRGKFEHIGKFLMGLALMLFSLTWIRESAEPLKDSELLAMILQSLNKDPIMAVAIIALVTWIAHSSLAVVLLLSSLVLGGVLPPDVGIVMVLGANLGGAVAPVLATLRDSHEAARVPVGNIITRLSGVLVCLPFADLIHNEMLAFGSNPQRLIVDFHVIFNVGLAAIYLPWTGSLSKLCTKLLPHEEDEDDPGRARYLDNRELDTPSIALSSAIRETLRMADVLQAMLEKTVIAMRDNDEALVREIKKKDDIIDSLYKAVKMYMAKITRESLDPEEAYHYVQILSFSSNIENAGDTIDKSLMEMALKKIDDRAHFSREGWKEIQEIHAFVMETLHLAQSVFVSGDSVLARRMLESKEDLRLKEQQATVAHMARIREGVPETIATSSLHLDIIRDYRRINSAMVSVAYPILEETGQLRSSRLKTLKKN